MGFLPLQRSQHRESLIRFSTTESIRIQGFAPSWRFDPPGALRPYFMPVTLMGLSPSEVSPSGDRHALFEVPLPTGRWLEPRPAVARRLRQRAAAYPLPLPGYPVFIPPEVRCANHRIPPMAKPSVFPMAAPDPPLGFLPSRASLPPR